MDIAEFARHLLPGLPVEQIYAAYAAADGDELGSGKFASPESSAALAANCFGYFIERPEALPAFTGCEDIAWPALRVMPEQVVRFPWRGGRHPNLDALIETPSALIGVESKRYEPYRSKVRGVFSPAYSQPVWGEAMRRYEAARDALAAGKLSYIHLDATQLVKHAFGLRSAVHRLEVAASSPILLYLYAEPARWHDGKPLPAGAFALHRREIADFAARVAGDEVRFIACDYGSLLASWREAGDSALAAHAGAVATRFAV